MALRYLPTGFNVGSFIVHNWTFALAITREVDPMQGDFCVCWIGTFELLTDDGGGWQSPEGIALGFDAEGRAIADGQWNGPIPSLDLAPPGATSSHPLALWAEIAPKFAAYGELLIPVVSEALTIDADIEQALATMDADPSMSSPVGEGMKIALGLLWASEGERLDGQ